MSFHFARNHRRDFLKASLASSSLVALGAGTVPGFLARSARAAASVADEAKAGGDRILVVVQLLGGNDGLNTVVPVGQDGYLRGRRALRLPTGQLHKIDKELSFHPGMGQMAKLLEQGRLSVLQGVGYPNPDRSHFRSMEIWETARTESGVAALETGWLGRALDAHPAASGADLPALAVGGRLPLALKAKKADVPALESLEQYRLKLNGDDAAKRSGRQAIEDLARARRDDSGDDPLLGFVRRSALSAYDSSQRLEQLAKKDAKSSYPDYGLAKRLELVAQVIKAGFGTRIYYTAQDGYDTHANQLGAHAGLLTELSDSLAAFLDDLTKAGQGDRVAVLVFSEFGRRVAENASAGTDHGAAAPVFVVGPVAQAGPIGAHPSLEDLDDGDLKFHTDFRRVYAGLLDRWLGLPAAPLVGSEFEPLDLLKI
jgi:uncharacterized protein (DUF1501 family)